MTPSDVLQRATIFVGRADPAAARVFVRLPRFEMAEGAALQGVIVGPYCAYAHTLPFRVSFAATEAREGALLSAVVPDPCFWTPEMPHWYRVELELRRGDEVLARAERPLGIRRLAVRERRLYFENRAWVLRAVRRDQVPPTELAAWRESLTAMVVEGPDDELCAEASRVGAMIVAWIGGSEERLAGEIHRLGGWPSVVLAVLEPEGPLPERCGENAPNLLLACRMSISDGGEVPPWADVAICEDDDTAGLAQRARNVPLPVLALRRPGTPPELGAARAQCDRLQAELAGHGEFCGYVV